MILDLDLGQEVAKNRIGLISVTSVDHDMTSQNFTRKKGTSHQIGLTENGFNLKKLVFMSRIVLLDPKLTPPPCQFQQFSTREKFCLFPQFLGRLNEKREAATPLIDQFC